MSRSSPFQFPLGDASLARLILSVLAAGLLTACASATPSPQTSGDAALDDWYATSLHWARTAAEHQAIFEQTFRAAAERLEKLAAGRTPGTWGISADADETLIDNSQYQLEIGRRGEAFGQESWNEWIQRRAAPALPGAVAFTRRVRELGGIVAVVTNRRTQQCAPTADNLRAVGITFDVVLCRLDDGQKEPRFDALVEGTAAQWPDAQLNDRGDPGAVDVLMWLGDNVGDFPDLDQQDRDREGAFADFGVRFFALPNPMYGSWEANPKN